VKIDLKGFTEKFYQETCTGERKQVLNTLTTLKKMGIWFQIVMLVIPTLNDSEKDFKDVFGHEGENTYCPHCQNIVIRRAGLSIRENRLKDNTFKDGNQSIPGIWS
jgi:pyruvate-formate lyase-activating enzyme